MLNLALMTLLIASLSSPCAKAIIEIASPASPNKNLKIEAEELAIRIAENSLLGDPLIWISTTSDLQNYETKIIEAFPHMREIREQFLSQSGNFYEDQIKEHLRIIREKESQLDESTLSTDGDIPRWSLVTALRYLLTPDMPEESEKKENQKKKEEKPEEKEEDSEPEPPDVPEQMLVQNWDLSESSSKKKYEYSRVNRSGITYWKSGVLYHLDLNAGMAYPVAIPEQDLKQNAEAHRGFELKQHAFKKINEWLPLLVPETFIPLEFKNDEVEVQKSADGKYMFRAQKETVQIPLLPQAYSLRPLSQQEKDFALQHNNIEITEWPVDLQEAILALKKLDEAGTFNKPGGTSLLARTLAHHISNFEKSRNRYATTAEDGCNVLKKFESKLFQCNAAAFAITEILRKEFKRPTRISVGFTGSADGRDSVVKTPETAHAWNEVWEELEPGRFTWVSIDGTPTKKEKEDDNKSESESEESTSNSGESYQSMADLIASIDQLNQQKLKELKEKLRSKADKDAERKKEEEDKNSQLLDELNQKLDELQKEKPVETLNDGTSKSSKPLHQVLIRWALEPHITNTQKLNRLSKIITLSAQTSATGLLDHASLLKIVRSLEDVILPGESTPQQIKDALRNIESIGLVGVSDLIVKAKIETQLTLNCLLEENALTLHYKKFLVALDRLQNLLLTSRHPASTLIRLAKDLDDHLPGNYSRLNTRKKFNIDPKAQIGSDTNSLLYGKGVAEGKLQSERLSSLLKINWVVKPDESPSKSTKRVPIPSSKLSRRHIRYHILDEPARIREAVNLDPSKSLVESFYQQQLVIPFTPLEVAIRKGTQAKRPRKGLSIIFDVSASMIGEREKFQKALIRSMLDALFSETDENGNEVENIASITPWGSKLHQRITMTKKSEIESVFEQLDQLTKNRGEGTEGEQAILGELDYMHKYLQDPNGIKRLTLAVLTDGEFTLNPKTISERLKSNDSRGNIENKIHLVFGAIGNTNADLARITDSNSVGADEVSYFEWTDTDIKDLNTKASSTKVENDFWTSMSFSDLPLPIRQAYDKYKSEIGSLVSTILPSNYRPMVDRVRRKTQSATAGFDISRSKPSFAQDQTVRFIRLVLETLSAPREEKLRILENILNDHQISNILGSPESYSRETVAHFQNLLMKIDQDD